MAQRRKKRKTIGAGLRFPGGVNVAVGVFEMKPSPEGKPRRIRIEFPAVLTMQEKYDVATALAKASAKLIAEADEENPQFAEDRAARVKFEADRAAIRDGVDVDEEPEPSFIDGSVV